MKLSASLYSSKQSSLIDAAKELEPYMVDYWHIDSREDFSVFADIDSLKKVSETPVDLHIITKNPADFSPELGRDNIRRVAFQIEEIEGQFDFPKLENKELGLAIMVGHPKLEETIAQYENQVDFVLLMMTTPGVSGGRFDKNHFAIISHLVHKFPNIQWCVDGGVNHEISYILRLIGVQSAVVGSYLLNHENMAQAILKIRSNHVRSEYHVVDFCIALENLPIVTEKTRVVDLLTIIQKHKLGIAFYVNENGALEGVISNADIRRVLIEGKFSYDMTIQEFVNRNPKCILESDSTSDMLEYIQKINFPILVLPVVDSNRLLKGAVSFHKLLRED
ncbi:MAG: CBS domain-containing protein [Chitinophagales bacterium]|nr:CBS domain-containing protein [Chitinophagales bacterium]